MTSSWSGGYQGALTVTNTGTTALTSWKLSVVFPGGVTVTNMWNGINTGTTGTVTVANEPYNGSVAAEPPGCRRTAVRTGGAETHRTR